MPAPAVAPRTALRRALGDVRGERSARRLERAAQAFRDERFDDARRLLLPLAKAAPGIAEVRELCGLTLYRLGRFKAALAELEAFRDVSGSTEQHPVLADCHRALGRWADVQALWRELGAVSPSAELVTEGLIVTAGAKADRGELPAAIRMLERGWTMGTAAKGPAVAGATSGGKGAPRRKGRPPSRRGPNDAWMLKRGWKLPLRPRPHHLRRAYALADLYERAGRSPRARELFGWVKRHDPALADVADRVRTLR